MKLNAFQRFIANIILGTRDTLHTGKEFQDETIAAYARGQKASRTAFAILPMPFTEEQVQGRAYGEFITPAGFASCFGECTVPAPGPHGYEQRAYYVSRDDVNKGDSIDLVCHRPGKFDKPADSDKLIPVIVTVLR